MAIELWKILPFALMSEHRETAASVPTQVNGDSYQPPSLQACLLKPLLPQTSTGIIQNLDKMIEAELAKLGCHAGKGISVKLTNLPIGNKTFAIGDIVFYFRKVETKVSAEFSFEKASGDHGAVLREAVYHFSIPVLAGANIEARPAKSLGLDGLMRTACGEFSDEDVSKILDGMAVTSYDKSATGIFLVPTMVAFDEIRVSTGKDGALSVRFALKNKQSHQRGWGMFSFGVSQKGCTSSKEGDAPGEFLGNGFGGTVENPVGINECMSVEMGERTRKAFVAWMIKGRKKNYNSFLEQSGQNSVAATAFLLNEVMGVKSKKAPDSWEKFAREETALGRGYFLWRTQTAMASQE